MYKLSESPKNQFTVKTKTVEFPKLKRSSVNTDLLRLTLSFLDDLQTWLFGSKLWHIQDLNSKLQNNLQSPAYDYSRREKQM